MPDGDGGDGGAAQSHEAEEAEAPKMVLLPLDRPLLYIVTGHEDGCVRFWTETVRTFSSTSTSTTSSICCSPDAQSALCLCRS